MASDSKLPIVIFFGIVVLIALPLLFGLIRERRRPVVVEARIVTASSTDPVFRDGPRRVPPGESVQAAIALRIHKTGGPDFWLAPVADLSIDGRDIEHIESGGWPDEGRELRVFWFSVESANLGGRLDSQRAADLLRYRTFLAPEMGRELLASRLPETHHDDHIGEESETGLSSAGTLRLYARIEVVEKAKDIQALQMVATLGLEDIDSPNFPTISRSFDFGGSIDPAAGELFRLPGFEASDEPEGSWNSVPVAATGHSFTDLVESRLIVSSRTFTAVALTGSSTFDPADLTPRAEFSVGDEKYLARGRPLEWGSDVKIGDVVKSGERWVVLLADDGNGILDPSDSVLHCWGRPPQRTTLLMALPGDALLAHLLRHE